MPSAYNVLYWGKENVILRMVLIFDTESNSCAEFFVKVASFMPASS